MVAVMEDIRSLPAAAPAAPLAAAARHIGPQPLHAPAAWQEWITARPVARLGVADIVPARQRLVVVAPHPDDELLACGLLMQAHAQQGGRSLIIGVTDGEASHAGDPGWAAPALAAARREERLAGLRALGLQGAPLRLLGLSDGGVAQQRPALARALHEALAPGDVVVSTWRLDGHPDHEACGAAAAEAARAAGATLWEAPVWMWHWADPAHAQIPWQRLRALRLGGSEAACAVARKQMALAHHRSQLAPRAGGAAGADGAGPVLDAAIVQRAAWPFETFFAPA